MSAAEDSNGVVISLPSIYAEVVATRAEVAKLSQRIDTLPDHERRLRWLEKAVWASGGVGTAIGGTIVVVAMKALGLQ